MRKSLVPFLIVALIVSALVTPGQTVHAQGISLPATINKNFSDLNITPGGTSLLRIFIFNPNAFPLTNASLTDNMPAGLRVVGVTSNTCGAGSSVTATPGSSTITLNGGTVPAQSGATPGSCIVTVNVTAPNPGTFTNTIPANTLTSSGPGGITVSNISAASATLVVDPAGLPSVSKSFSPTNILAGGTSRLTINITNGASTTLTGVTLPDNLPTGVTLANPVSPTLTGCGGSASVAGTSGGSTVTLNNGTIPSGGTCTITVNVTSNVQGAYTNRIPQNTLGNNQGLSNPTAATPRLNVRGVSLTKRFSPGTFGPGETTTLTITLQNPTSAPYTGVALTDHLPTPLIATGVASSTCGVPPGTVSTNPNTTVSLAGGTIPAATAAGPGICTISVQVTVPPGTPSGQLTNTIAPADFSMDQPVGLLSPATASVTISGTEVTGGKSFSPSSIGVGINSRLRIDTFAPGDTDLTNFSIRDDLPTGVSVSNSQPPAVAGCGAGAVLAAATGATSISLTGGLILAGQRCRIEVYVTSNTPSPAGTPYANSIPPGNISNDQNRVPTSAFTSNLTVTGAGALAISVNKRFEPPEVFNGAASTMSVRLTNPGAVTLTGVTFEDKMPTGMILADPVNFDVGACGGTLTGNPGDGSFIFSGGTLLPTSSCTLTLSATMAVNGNLINTIPAGSVHTDNQITNLSDVFATLSNLPGASVDKSFAPNPIPVGSFSLLTITVENSGNIALTGLGVSDSLPAGLEIAGGAVPAPVNNCGGTFTATAGTQLIELINGSLAGNSSCTMVVAITGSGPGNFQNTIPAGALRTDPAINVTNTTPATDTLVITGNPVGGGGGGGGGGGAGRGGQGGGDGVNQKGASATNRTSLIPVTGFAPGRVTRLDASSRIVYDPTSLTIDIPVLKVKTPIVGVASKNGSWDVSWLQDQVGWLNGTAYPTWKGNSVLTGHVANTDGKSGVFSKLKALGLGEYIYVYSAGYRYTYKVVSNTFVQPNDATVMKHEEKSYLTLITCDTYDEKTATYLRRVAVRALLVDVREIK